MTPAIVILAIVWFLLIVPGKIAPLTALHFGSMQLSGVLGVAGLTIWWILSKGVPVRTRILGYTTILGITITGIFFGHPSNQLVMFIYGLPTAFSLLIGALFVFRNQRWSKRGWIGVFVYATFFIGSLFVRSINHDAAFHFNIAPRWTLSAEEKFIAKLETQTAEVSAVDLAMVPTEITQKDWAEFRGPRRDGVVKNAEFDTDWDANPPQQLWRKSVGPAWSSFCVVGDTFFTQEQRDNDEAVVAYSAIDGNPLWILKYPSRFKASLGGVGPRATPTMANGKLYTMGANGRVDCLNPQNGDSLWTFDAMEDRKNPIMQWGFSASPLVHGGQVFLVNSDGPGRGVIALDAETGKRNWRAGKGSHSYSSCQLETIDDVDQIIVTSDWGIQGLEPKRGELLWEHKWDIGPGNRVTQPLVVGNTVYLTTGYGNGTRRLDIAKTDAGQWDVTEGWTTHLLKPYFNDAVHFEGYLYGFDGPIMVCLDAETGKKQWKGGRYGHGQVLLLPKLRTLLVVTEKGKLVLLEVNPKKRIETAKMQAVEGVTWNHPVVAGKRLFVRNAKEMVCYQLAD